MPAYNFNARFVEQVEKGLKCQTIRKTMKWAKRGSIAYLYTGQRTKKCRKIGEGIICDVLPIEIGLHSCGEPYAEIEYDMGRTRLVHNDFESLAMADGFHNGEQMIEWFTTLYGLPFIGYLHKWIKA